MVNTNCTLISFTLFNVAIRTFLNYIMQQFFTFLQIPPVILVNLYSVICKGHG